MFYFPGIPSEFGADLLHLDGSKGAKDIRLLLFGQGFEGDLSTGAEVPFGDKCISIVCGWIFWERRR